MKQRGCLINFYSLYFFIRRFLLALLVTTVNRANDHWARAVLFFLCAIPPLILVIVARPFKSKVNNITLAVNEGFVVLMSFLFMVLPNKDHWKVGVEWLVMIIIAIYVAILTIISVIELLKDVKSAYKEKFVDTDDEGEKGEPDKELLNSPDDDIPEV
jgi:hypothetical protein